MSRDLFRVGNKLWCARVPHGEESGWDVSSGDMLAGGSSDCIYFQSPFEIREVWLTGLDLDMILQRDQARKKILSRRDSMLSE